MKIYYYYEIVNLINNKKYIGITTNIQNRWTTHFRELKKNCHHSTKLQNAFNKYGEKNFQFNIIIEKSFEKNIEAYLYEIGLINKNNSKNNGYNMTNKISPMAVSEIAKKVKLKNQEKVENILQIDMNNKQIIKVFSSLREAERETGVFRSNITDVCKRKKVKAGNYYWAFEKDYDENWIPKLNEKSIPLALIDENNFILRVFDSAADASRKLKIDRSNIRSSILRNGSCGGYKFIRITHDQYYQYFKNL